MALTARIVHVRRARVIFVREQYRPNAGGGNSLRAIVTYRHHSNAMTERA